MVKKNIQSAEPNITELGNGWLTSNKLDYKFEQAPLNEDIRKVIDDFFSNE